MIRISGTAQEMVIILSFLRKHFASSLGKTFSGHLSRAEEHRHNKEWLIVLDLQVKDSLAEEIISAMEHSTLQGLVRLSRPTKGCSFYSILGKVFLERVEALD